jgi:hypothetical protein
MAKNTSILLGDYFDKFINKQVKAGNTENVLNYLRTQAKNKLHRAVAKVVFNLGIKTKIKYVERLPKGRLAQYDPNTDTVLVTTEGLKDPVLLHEFVHAATIKVLDKYERGDLKGLTEQQIEAAEMLEDIMDRAESTLGKKYPSAFENLFEFVSYAMTDSLFQQDLEVLKLDVKQGGKMVSFPTILPETKSAWSDFMNSVLNLLGLGDKMFKGQETNYDARNALLEIFQAVEEPHGCLIVVHSLFRSFPDRRGLGQRCCDSGQSTLTVSEGCWIDTQVQGSFFGLPICVLLN